MGRRKTHDIEQFVDEVLVYLGLAASNRQNGKIRLSRFDGAELMHPGFVEMLRAAGSEVSEPLIPANLDLRELHLPFDVSTISKVLEQGRSSLDAALFAASRTSILPRPRRRGLPRAQQYLREEIAIVERDGSYVSAEKLSGRRGKNWFRFEPMGAVPYGTATGEDPSRFTMLGGLQWTMERRWRVLLRYEGAPSVGFMTDPQGARGIFRLRNVPEGKERRAALRNWVSEHWRQDRHDPELERKVRQHLRGATGFAWQGFECDVVIPPEALREEFWHKIMRIRERELGLDVRPRRRDGELDVVSKEGQTP